MIENIIWEGEHGGAVFNATALSGKKYRFVAGQNIMPRPPLSGEVWEIGGKLRNHPEYGEQVETRSAILRRPSGKLIVSTISKSKMFPGIGVVKAEKLWTEFGDLIYEMLGAAEFTPFASMLGNELARVLVNGWTALSVEAEVFRYLDMHGLPFWMSQKLISIYENDVVEKLEENPYRLLAFTSWHQADRVARSIGIDPHDKRRLIAAVEAVSYQRLQHSHTWTKKREVHSRVRHLLGCDSETATDAINLALENYAIVVSESGLQGVGPAAMEQYIVERIREMICGEFEAVEPTFNLDPNYIIDDVLTAFEAEASIILNQIQRDAVRMAMTSPLSIITGGAGVGKTTVLKAIHAASERIGRGVYQMALAGRAAKRMTEATGRPATTIMGFLNAVDAEKMELNAEPFLVIDEASMIDLPMMYRIFRRMEPGCKLLLVGDPAQLPPIGFGLVFHVLCKDSKVPRVELKVIHRQAASSGIPQISTEIRNGIIPTLNKYQGSCPGVTFIDCAKSEIVDKILDVTNDLGGVSATQVIGVVKNGSGGTRNINDVFHKLLTPGRREHLNFSEGEPVIWTVNNQNLDLQNGSLGVVRSALNSLEVEFDGERKVIFDDDVGDMEHAYAITCHKSQGSQFKRVIIPIVASRILDRSLLYTAITRAQEQVVLVGDRKAFEEAITNPPNPDVRETGLEFLLAAD